VTVLVRVIGEIPHSPSRSFVQRYFIYSVTVMSFVIFVLPNFINQKRSIMYSPLKIDKFFTSILTDVRLPLLYM